MREWKPIISDSFDSKIDSKIDPQSPDLTYFLSGITITVTYQRIERLQSLCSNNYKPEEPIIDQWRKGVNPDVRFVVDERHKILYCELPKVGCTNWKRTMLQLIHPDTFGRLDFNHIKG